jgi:hypothetical protein
MYICTFSELDSPCTFTPETLLLGPFRNGFTGLLIGPWLATRRLAYGRAGFVFQPQAQLLDPA